MTKKSADPSREIGLQMSLVAFPETAVLDIKQLCEWLGISKRQAERQGFPCFYMGTRTRRYSVRQVLAFLEKKAA